jgi:hypothetical protein
MMENTVIVNAAPVDTRRSWRAMTCDASLMSERSNIATRASLQDECVAILRRIILHNLLGDSGDR